MPGVAVGVDGRGEHLPADDGQSHLIRLVHPRLEQVRGCADPAQVEQVVRAQPPGVDGLEAAVLDEYGRGHRFAHHWSASLDGELLHIARPVGDQRGWNPQLRRASGGKLHGLVLGARHRRGMVHPSTVQGGQDTAEAGTGLGGGEPRLRAGHPRGETERPGGAVVHRADPGQLHRPVLGGEFARPRLLLVDPAGQAELLREVRGIHAEHLYAATLQLDHDPVRRPVIASCDDQNGRRHQSFGPSSSGGGFETEPSGTVGECVLAMQVSRPPS